MIPELYKNYTNYFNIGCALSSFFIMNSDEIDAYLNNIEKAYKKFKNIDGNIYYQINLEKIKKDTVEVLNYAKNQFNVIVAENDMKMQYLYNDDASINYYWPDRYISFAKQNNQKVRWHTLVWHSQVADCIFYDNNKYCSKNILENRLKSYIYNLGNRYKNDVYSIDVVNECISDKTFELRNGKEKSKWYEILGDSYIKNSFIWAKEAFPKSNLIINDYNLESSAGKRNAMVTLLKQLLAENVPVDTVGLQMHVSINNPPISEIEKTINSFADLGLKIIISELDVSIYEDDLNENKLENKKNITNELLQLQAQRYFDLFECFKKYSDIITDVIFWGITDRFSWRNDFPVKGREDAPLLFDRKGNPKPCFFKLLEESNQMEK